MASVGSGTGGCDSLPLQPDSYRVLPTVLLCTIHPISCFFKSQVVGVPPDLVSALILGHGELVPSYDLPALLTIFMLLLLVED
jgi:hypothetical protein